MCSNSSFESLAVFVVTIPSLANDEAYSIASAAPSSKNVVSLEICGGPHVDHTGQLAEGGKTFKIIKIEMKLSSKTRF